MRSSDSRDVESLLRHAGWMRSLARSLVADPNVAEDLVQDTWVAALEHPRSEGGWPKRWLAAVLRNSARQARRRSAHREQREERSARQEAIASTHDAVASAQLQRSLVEAVLALEEPYRDVIVWRYFEGLPPREIAERLRVPVNTVKTRLARGIEKLRAELDRRSGGNREAWLPALIPFALRPEVPASTLWMILVNTNLKLALVAALVVGVLVGIWTLGRSRPAEPLAPTPSIAEIVLPPPGTVDANAAAPTVRSEGTTEPSKPESATTGSTASAPILAQGHVVDGEGRSVPGIQLVSGSPTETSTLATSAGDGSFTIPSAKLHGNLFARDAQYTTVFGVDAWFNAPMSGLVVVVAPRILLAGVVVDDAGRPIGGVEVHVRPEKRFEQDLGLITDQSFEVRTATATDDAGRFEIQDAPSMPHARIDVVAAGFDLTSVAAPRKSTKAMKFVLVRVGNPVIHGEVIDAHNQPVPGAWLAAGGKVSCADDEGRFVISPGEIVNVENGVAQDLALVVVKEGFLPVRIPKPATGWPADLVVRLVGEPLSIRGHVVDTDDRPVEGVEVWIPREEHFAMLPAIDSNAPQAKSIEGLLRGSSGPSVTDAKGVFELSGLLPKEYRLAASQLSTLHMEVTEPIHAGSASVTIRLSGTDRCARVAGRVVSRSKKPVAGVLVFPLRVLDSGDHSTYATKGQGRLTDLEGKFAFESLCTDHLYLQIVGANIEIVFRWDPPAGAKLDDLEIVVALRCHVQVDLGAHADLADEFEILAEDGTRLDLVLFEGPRASIGQSRKIQDGRSDILAVSEASRTLVLKKGGTEIQRLPVRLVPGEVTVVRP